MELTAYKGLSEEEKKSKARPSTVHVWQKVGKEFWDLETPEFQEEMAEVA